MNIITTPAQYTAAHTAEGFVRVCHMCKGSGQYGFNRLTGETHCYTCNGSGVSSRGKVYTTVEAFDVAYTKAEKARERIEAKRDAEWAAGAAERQRIAEEAQAAEVAEAAELASWKHLDASEGSEVTVTGTVVFTTSFENNFGGTTVLVSIETADKEAIKVFSSAQWAWNVNRDETITITGIVGSFGEYEGRAETTLKRAKRVS